MWMSMSGSMERRRRPVCLRTGIIAIAAVAVTGCATMGGPDLTDDEKALRDDSQIFNETVLGGAAAGAALGGLSCMLLGQSVEECIPEMMVGGAVGAAGGYLVATKQAAANEHVRQTDVVTRDVVADNEKLAKLVSLARSVLNENRAAAEALQARIASNEAESGEIEAMQAKLRSNVDVLNNAIGKLNERRGTYVEALASLESEGEDTTALRRQVREMEDQIAQLIQYRSALEEEMDVELMG